MFNSNFFVSISSPLQVTFPYSENLTVETENSNSSETITLGTVHPIKVVHNHSYCMDRELQLALRKILNKKACLNREIWRNSMRLNHSFNLH